jgi:hypothetical protein
MLEIWVDNLPENPRDYQKTTCDDFLTLIQQQHIVICTTIERQHWSSKQYKEWKDFFDDVLGIGVFDRYRSIWQMPIQKEKNQDSYEATTLLCKPPDELLRLTIHSQNKTIISNAEEFSEHFSIMTSGSTRVKIYDRYLLSFQNNLMSIQDNKVTHRTEFKKGDFIDSVRSLSLLITALNSDVEELEIFSEMLSFSKFRTKILMAQNKSELSLDFDIKEEWKKWYKKSNDARRTAAETILSELHSSDRKLTITFFDCSTDDRYPTMEHDRYVKYSQNRALISSGGFRNVYSDIDEETDFGLLPLNPKTFLIKIMLDVDTNVEGPHRHLVVKDII